MLRVLRPWLEAAFSILLAFAVTCVPALALAQAAPPTADRSEIEAKKKEREEREKRKAEAATKYQETTEQKEARERQEHRDGNAKEARKKAEQAIQAASKRQNQKGMELMNAAWMLDPLTLDYPLNTAEFAKAVNNAEVEFAALAAVRILALKQMAGLPETAQRRKDGQAALTAAEERIAGLKTHLSIGLLRLKSEPKGCEIFVEGAWVGQGEGEIETLTGQKKATTVCAGYSDHEQFVNVRVGDPSSYTIKPKQIAYFGKLIVKVEPSDGVTVLLDDIPVAERLAEKPTADGKIGGAGTRKEPYQLAARKWVIRFQKDGYERWHRRIEVRRDEPIMIEARLEPMNETVESPDKAPLPIVRSPAPVKPADK